MADMMAYRGPGGGWIYPSLEEALKKAGVCSAPWSTVSPKGNNA